MILAVLFVWLVVILDTFVDAAGTGLCLLLLDGLVALFCCGVGWMVVIWIVVVSLCLLR